MPSPTPPATSPFGCNTRLARRLLIWTPVIQSEGESSDSFQMRVQAFRKRVPRGSDFSYRIALAYKALVLDGEKGWRAAEIVAESLDR